jgi:hypothetical protein
MKKSSFLLLLIFIYSACHLSAQDKSHWQLVWNVEFNGDFIDWNVWSKIHRGILEWKRHASNYDLLYAVEDGCLALCGIGNTAFSEDSVFA